MIDARTLLLAEQTYRDCNQHATADLFRDAAAEISVLRKALVDIKYSTYLRRAQAIAETALDGGKHWTDKT